MAISPVLGKLTHICFIELYCIYIISVLYLYGICKLVKYVKPQFSCWSGGWARLTGEDCGGLRSTMMIKIYFYLMEIYCGGLRNTMIKCMKIYLYSPEWGIQWWKYICTSENIFLLDGNIFVFHGNLFWRTEKYSYYFENVGQRLTGNIF